jgi:very-short-patch-repair endonuclease
MSADTRHHVPPTLLQQARAMRHHAAPAEWKLWQCLRNRQLAGPKFRRQQPLAPFIADFFCSQAKLVIELDGESHNVRQSYDFDRTLKLERDGWDVLRFQNAEVNEDLETVLEKILIECESRIGASLDSHDSPSPRPSPTRGEGVRHA